MAATGFTLDWKGDNVQKRVERAAKNAIDRVMADCVVTAKQLVRVKTATLQGSIRFEPADNRRGNIVGVWGSFDVDYAIWQEIGTSRMRGKPYLRPAQDQHYHKLKGYIQDELGRGS